MTTPHFHLLVEPSEDNLSRAQEYNYSPQNSELLWGLFKNKYAPKGGYCTIPDAPGIGLELDEKALQALSLV